MKLTVSRPPNDVSATIEVMLGEVVVVDTDPVVKTLAVVEAEALTPYVFFARTWAL